MLYKEVDDNGIKLADFAIMNNKVISSTLFPHKKILKWTSRAPHGEKIKLIMY
jgi:hypothetical protein